MHKSVSLIAGIVLLIGAVLVPIVATVITFILPEFFASTARMVPAVTEPGAIATEMELIRSKTVLLPVLTNLNLARTWAQKYNGGRDLPVDLTYTFLSERCVIEQIKGTNLIQISVLSDDRTEAAAIANEIALVYTKSPLAARGADGKTAPQVIDKATPALRPARPNKVLNIGGGMGVGAILALLGIWLVLNRGFRRPRTSDESIRIMTGGQPPSQPPPVPRP